MSIGSVSAVVLCFRSESWNLFRRSDLALHLKKWFDLLLDVGRIGIDRKDPGVFQSTTILVMFTSSIIPRETAASMVYMLEVSICQAQAMHSSFLDVEIPWLVDDWAYPCGYLSMSM
jgi:hypothetical protein